MRIAILTLLPTTYYLLLTAYCCLLLATCYLGEVKRCDLELATYYLLHATDCFATLITRGCCSLLAPCSLLPTTHHSPLTTHHTYCCLQVIFETFTTRLSDETQVERRPCA